MLRPTAVWHYTSASGYADLSANVKTDSSISFLLLATDYFYIGLDRRSVGLYSDVSTVGSYTGITYEYLNSLGTWTKLSMIDAYNFNASKYARWVSPNDDWMKFNFTSTSPHAATPPDTVERYWFRIYCSAVTTQAVISKLRVIPFTLYTTPTKVSQFLQLKKDFANDTKPTDLVVEQDIRRAEDRIDYRTRKSWRFNMVTETTDPKLVDYNRFGMYMRHKNFIKVYSVQLYNGASWDTLTEGRANDYFVDYDIGIIYMTRLFLLPAIYGMMGRYSQYQYGEFKKAITVDYAYGRNWETDTEFYIAEDLATKMVAIDTLRHHDYSSLIVSGSDKISLDSKVANLEEEIEMRLDELTSISIS